MELIEFIIEAKLAGYATGGETTELTFENGFKGFEFKKSGFHYVDKYFGFNPFAGSESVYDSSGSLIWVMNYYGEVYEVCDEPKLVYETLKLAMRQISLLYPYRGPNSFEHEGLYYRNRQFGTPYAFNGREIISRDGLEVYSLSYHGGSLVQYT